MRIVAPFGFYGAGNIGDEATLQGFARLVSRSSARMRVAVASRNPRHTSRVEPSFRYFRTDRRGWKRYWAEKLASGLVVAGGTPIMDGLGKWPLCEVTPLVEEGHRQGKAVAFIGVGTEHLEREESRRIVRERLGPRVGHWTVRSPQDHARLVDYGIPREQVTVTADMAWLLDPASPDWGRQRLHDWGVPDDRTLIGVNLLGEKAVLQREPHLFEKVAQFLDHVVEAYGAFVLFLANEVRDEETFDTAAARTTRRFMTQKRHTFVAPNEYLAPQQMQSLIANCHATASMRYHFCLFSALEGVPFVALQRSGKVVDLCSDLQWPYGVELNGITVADLVTQFEMLEAQRAGAIRHLGQRTASLTQEAGRNQLALDGLCDRQSVTAASASGNGLGPSRRVSAGR